ncbi:MAG: hypothetical protein H7Y86_19215, partial [Rhizobacter sp.]|nr:hypothetical protein [Ferruginibacter sp.]
MKSPGRLFFLILVIQTIFAAVGLAQVQQPVTQANITTGRLTTAEYDSVRTLLKQYSTIDLKDTIILKYQYDVVPAGNQPNTLDVEIIQQMVTGELRKLHSAMAKRKNISLFNLTAPGTAADSLLMYNNLAMIDTSGILQRLLLTRKSSTSSVILMPGRQFICFTAAAGWE